jgi:ABC-type multidrug transport system fused ATPase/permease subunit
MTQLLIFQIISILLIAAVFVAWQVSVKRRNRRSWEQILARLRVDWSGHALSESFPWRPEMPLSPDETWLQIQGVRGLSVMYRNAGVMLEIADYAVRNSTAEHEVDPMLIAALRSDALQIRIFALLGLSQYGFLRTTAGVRTNAQRAAIHYTVLTARLISLLQDHAAIILPNFIEAV